ncbi:MAG TPA: phage tail assembly chaperone [Bauldia sp.]|nr:phage tail assembly chaperone [Bauldia sp.]
MAFGLGRLRLPPAAFWRATLRELSAAAEGAGAARGARMERDALDRLIKRFPDGA